jgi:hypothetical protein
VIVSLNQPAYLPWLGYFDRIAASDLHVVLDDVQYEKNSFINRNKVRTAAGSCWLTVPVKASGNFRDLRIDNLRIVNDPRWSRKHWRTIEQNYCRARYFADHRDFFAAVYSRQLDKLIDLTTMINAYLLRAFGIRTRLLRSSSLALVERKSALVLEICRRVKALIYLSGPLGRAYLDCSSFAQAGIEVEFHDYRHPSYSQVHPGFEPYMAAIDLLFTHGPAARDVFRTTRRELVKMAR